MDAAAAAVLARHSLHGSMADSAGICHPSAAPKAVLLLLLLLLLRQYMCACCWQSHHAITGWTSATRPPQWDDCRSCTPAHQKRIHQPRGPQIRLMHLPVASWQCRCGAAPAMMQGWLRCNVLMCEGNNRYTPTAATWLSLRGIKVALAGL